MLKLDLGFYHSPIKRTKAPWRNGQSRAGAGKIQYEPEKVLKEKKKKRGCRHIKGTQVKSTSNVQSWDNVNNKNIV